jgi:hypothetical protein
VRGIGARQQLDAAAESRATGQAARSKIPASLAKTNQLKTNRQLLLQQVAKGKRGERCGAATKALSGAPLAHPTSHARAEHHSHLQKNNRFFWAADGRFAASFFFGWPSGRFAASFFFKTGKRRFQGSFFVFAAEI